MPHAPLVRPTFTAAVSVLADGHWRTRRWPNGRSVSGESSFFARARLVVHWGSFQLAPIVLESPVCFHPAPAPRDVHGIA